MKTVVTKGEFARLKQRSPQCISKWLVEGKISAAALVGEGHRARIWVEQAERDLVVALDPAQQAGQAHPVRLDLPPGSLDAPIAPNAPAPSLKLSAGSAEDEDLRRRRKADADKAEHDAESARRKLMLDEGRWLESGLAMKEWGRELGRVVGETETFLFNTLARELAERFGLDWKQVSTLFRESYRKHRSSLADGARTMREDEEVAPELAEAAE